MFRVDLNESMGENIEKIQHFLRAVDSSVEETEVGACTLYSTWSNTVMVLLTLIIPGVNFLTVS